MKLAQLNSIDQNTDLFNHKYIHFRSENTQVVSLFVNFAVQIEP